MYSEENNHCFNCRENRVVWLYRTVWDIGTVAENLFVPCVQALESWVRNNFATLTSSQV